MWRTVVCLALVAAAAARPDLLDIYQSYGAGQQDVADSSSSGDAVRVEASRPGDEETAASANSSGTEEAGTDACLEPVEVGVCRASIKRWAFDKKTARCRSFPWGGCGGTANNFRTEAACRVQCAPLLEAAQGCSDPADCPDACDRRRNTDTGCLQCDCPAVGGPCGLPVVQGPCKAAIPRFAYKNGVCREFLFGGCDGNANNFETVEDCELTCGGGAWGRY